MSTLLSRELVAFPTRREHPILRIWVEHSTAWWFTGHRFILKQRGIRLLLEGSVDGTNGDDKAGRFLFLDLAASARGHGDTETNHARARKRVPAESDTIAILDVAPLVLQSVVVHDGWVGTGRWTRLDLVIWEGTSREKGEGCKIEK